MPPPARTDSPTTPEPGSGWRARSATGEAEFGPGKASEEKDSHSRPGDKAPSVASSDDSPLESDPTQRHSDND